MKTALDRLTPLELQIARWLAEGVSVAEIARRRGRSPDTVKAQRRGIFIKLAALNITTNEQLAEVLNAATPG